MLKLIEDGAVWGYNIPYLLTGLTDHIRERPLQQQKIMIQNIWIFIICCWMTDIEKSEKTLVFISVEKTPTSASGE